MRRSWDGCLREVVGERVKTLGRLYMTGPRRGRVTRVRVALLECGHAFQGLTGKAFAVGCWVMCSECREFGDPRKSTTGQE